jgi:hypothetical protein
MLMLAAMAGCHGRTEQHESPRPAPAERADVPLSQAELIQRGEQLVKLGGCNDCHTPVKFDEKLGRPVPIRDLMLSGHPQNAPEPKSSPTDGDQAVIGATFTSFRAPFGVVYAANLTPDPETGLGDWSESEFVATMRSGKHKGTGRAILPPMPWQNLAAQPEENLRAIYAYLRTVPPVKNSVSAPRVPEAVITAMAKGNDTATSKVQ